MNELSWMIYAAGVTGSVGTVLVTASIFSGIISLVSVVIGMVIAADRYYDVEEGSAKSTRIFSIAKRSVFICIATAVIASLTPSPKTVYAIAASQYGEKVLASETAGKAVQALDAWLDQQIGGDKEGEQK